MDGPGIAFSSSCMKQVGFGSPALRPISQVFVATAGAGMQQHQLPCILGCRNVHQQCSWCPLIVFLCTFHGRILFLSPLSSDFVPDLFYASFERLIVSGPRRCTTPRNAGKIESVATDDQGSLAHSSVERPFTLIYSVLLHWVPKLPIATRLSSASSSEGTVCKPEA